MADGQVRVLSTGLVQAAEQLRHTAEAERIPLTPCDLRFILLGPIQKGLLFRKPTTGPTDGRTTFIHSLKSSFSRALASFYPFAGRLSVDKHAAADGGRTASVYIDCNNNNNAGALFVHAAADGVSVADVLEPLYVPPVLWSFFPLNWMRNHHGFSEPLLAVQVTELVDGFFIGCTINHVVADGATFWRFMNFWSGICRSGGGGGGGGYSAEMMNGSDKSRVFSRQCREKLAALKAQANAESAAAAAAGSQISSLQSLISHIWRAVFRNRSNNPDPDRDRKFLLFFGFRSRLQPRVLEDYFGNALVSQSVVLKEGELLVAEKGLGRVAAAVNRVVAEQTDEKLKEAMESWIKNPKFLKIGELEEGMMLLGSSPRYDVYGNDFGWGKPVAVRSGAGNKFDGKVTVYPGVEAGSMDVEVCLLPETAERLGRDLEFMAAVGA
ncbi:unnamed protein product [Linum tenue]|uniref:HXXXD-type acyl-transferase family protein n=1 Tax=Linum tenue TaxID=586396 RepID=A0AAV0QHE3_9ROSI|nr:unnamed protein product [Linum tenue]